MTVRHRRLRAAAVLTAMALGLAACGGGGGAPTGGTPVNGGTATYALPPNTVPNYIFPFAPIQFFSVANSAYFQALMYRPLYWFGKGATLQPNNDLSLADPPTFSGDTVTLTLKPYKWSDGSAVTSADVLFWVHMEQAEKANWADYVPGEFPDNIKSVSAPDASTVTFTMDKAYSRQFMLYNELGQITPLPQAWDKTSDTATGSCAASVSGCAAVWTYLTGKAKNLKQYATDPLWSVVDGPWKLAAFNADGHVTFVPNPGYSGPVKPRLAKFQEAPFTTEGAEYNQLRSGNSLTVGYLPTVDAPAKPAGKAVGGNPVPNYTLDPLYLFSINYFPVNLNNPAVGPMFRQLYIRQSIQYMMDQKSVINGPLRGYGTYTVGPVPNTPADFLSPTGKRGDPFPFNPAAARQLLAGHGWTVVPGGVSTCTTPSLCGPGIKQGQPLEFTLQWATGFAWIEAEMTALQSNAAQIGMKIDLKGTTFNEVTNAAVPCTASQATCGWQAGNWGGGWAFVPDYYPSGDTLFATGAGSNDGSYSDPQNDALIAQTLTSSDIATFYQWQDYLAKQVPVIWQPNGVYELVEVSTRLRGAIPQNPYSFINPENWYFVK